jgi:hypothetical protein
MQRQGQDALDLLSLEGIDFQVLHARRLGQSDWIAGDQLQPRLEAPGDDEDGTKTASGLRRDMRRIPASQIRGRETDLARSRAAQLSQSRSHLYFVFGDLGSPDPTLRFRGGKSGRLASR